MQNSFSMACANNDIILAQALINHPNVDPAYNDNSAIVTACTDGHIKIVELLLADPRVDPSAQHNTAIRMSTMCGFVEIVKLLLADKRTDPTAQHNQPISMACRYGLTKIVELLIKSGKIKDDGIEAAKIEAAKNANPDLANKIDIWYQEVIYASAKKTFNCLWLAQKEEGSDFSYLNADCISQINLASMQISRQEFEITKPSI